MAWRVELTAKAEDELSELPADMRARFVRTAELLERFGPRILGMPHTRHLEKDLWELRMRGRAGISRALYFAVDDNRLIVVRVFVKKTQKTPRREIELALARKKDL